MRGLRLRPATFTLALVLVAAVPALLAAQQADMPALRGSSGIRPEAVRQGRLGSCYFFATVAAMAKVDPKSLENLMQENGDGTYTVRFSDGVTEKAYLDDIRYARHSGFDRSDGLWVGVLFRAYAQRVLREALVKSVDESELFPIVKKYAVDFLRSNDLLVLAYDRSIRAVVDQSGEINRAKLIAELKQQLKSVEVSDQVKEGLVGLLSSGGFFDALADTVKKNGELFGAYRAVGQGGIPAAVMFAFIGRKVAGVRTQAGTQALGVMAAAVQAGQPVVAGTRGESVQQLMADPGLPGDAKDWYVERHAYTVLDMNAGQGTVTLRNPWGEHPNPGGIFTIPLATFLQAFEQIQMTVPPSSE